MFVQYQVCLYRGARTYTLTLALESAPASSYFACAGDVKWPHTFRVQVTGQLECDPWDRCWCLLEMAVRDLAVKNRGKAPSTIIMPDRSVPKCLTHNR